MKVYLTGEGFLGSTLKQQLVQSLPLDYTHIPHKDIQTAEIKPFDYFFFCSTYGNLASHTDEDAIFKANIEDLLAVLRQIKNYPFKSFVYVSSSSVRLKVQTTYSRSKKAAEEILLAFMERHNLPVCIIRPYSITGVGEQNEHLIPTLIRSCLDGEKISFVPTPTHDFIDVEDVAGGIINLAEHSARGIFELGTGKSYTNQQVLDLVEDITGKKANVNIVPSLRSYDNTNWVSNNFKARGYGWLPNKTLKQSITEMVNYEKN